MPRASQALSFFSLCHLESVTFITRFVIFLSQDNYSKLSCASSREAQTKLRKGGGNSSVCEVKLPESFDRCLPSFSLHRAESYDHLQWEKKNLRKLVFTFMHNTWHLLSINILVFMKEDGDFGA